MTREEKAQAAANKRAFFWLTLIVLFFVFLFLIRSILLPFTLGVFIAYFLDPAADKLERHGMSRTLATLVIMGSFFLILLILGILLIPALSHQIAALIASVPGYVTVFQTRYAPRFETWLGTIPMLDIESVKSAFSDVSTIMVKMMGGFIGSVFQSGMAFVNILSLLLITPVVGFYMLQDWDRITAKVDALLPRAHADTIRSQLHLIDRTLSGFVRGQLNVCLLLSVYYVIGLTFLQLKFSIIIGVMGGMLVIVPYAGWMLSTITAVGLALLQYDSIGPVLGVFGVFFTGLIVENYGLTPRLVGNKVGLHPVWIIFGMLSGAALFGFVGVLLAVPATAVIGVLLRFAIQRYLLSSYYQGDRLTPPL